MEERAGKDAPGRPRPARADGSHAVHHCTSSAAVQFHVVISTVHASRAPRAMALFGCSAGPAVSRPAAARELAARGVSGAAAGAGRRRRPLQCRCDAVDQQDSAVVSAPAPLLTSKTAQRQKVSMMSLGCPKNVVDGAPPHGGAVRLRPCVSCHRRCVLRAASAAASCCEPRAPARACAYAVPAAAVAANPHGLVAEETCCCRRSDAGRLVQGRV